MVGDGQKKKSIFRMDRPETTKRNWQPEDLALDFAGLDLFSGLFYFCFIHDKKS
ncbi:hypothetical protein STRDD04_01081 [Streptococcus sp. DD04]|nr:hypothetical protein STRDD04_01081 [Streptococcus sp. DD04]